MAAAAAEGKVRVGFVSTAKINEKTLAAIRESGNCEVVAVASRGLDKAKEWAEEHGVEKAFGSYEELVDSDLVDALYISVPTGLRADLVKRAAAKGKHMVAEKPAATSIEELADMIEAVKAADVVWIDGVMMMHHERLLKVRQAVEQMGGARYVMSQITLPTGETTDDFLSDNIRVKPELEPFGALGDLGWYNIRISLAAFNWELPEKVRAECTHYQPGTKLPLDINVTLRFSDNRTSIFHNSFMQSFSQWVEIAGAKQRITYDDLLVARYPEYAEFAIIEEQPENDDREIKGKQDVQKIEGCNQERELWRRFGRLVTEGEKEGDERETKGFWRDMSLKTQAVLDACLKSAHKDGEWVQVHLPGGDQRRRRV